MQTVTHRSGSKEATHLLNASPEENTTNPLTPPTEFSTIYKEIVAKHMLLNVTLQIYGIWPQYCKQFLCKHELAIRNEGTGQARPVSQKHGNTEKYKHCILTCDISEMVKNVEMAHLTN